MAVRDDLAIVDDQVPFPCPHPVLEIEGLMTHEVLNRRRVIGRGDRCDRPHDVLGGGRDIEDSGKIGNTHSFQQAPRLGNMDLFNVDFGASPLEFCDMLPLPGGIGGLR